MQKQRRCKLKAGDGVNGYEGGGIFRIEKKRVKGSWNKEASEGSRAKLQLRRGRQKTLELER